jgi:hypothetical protein
MEELLPLPLPLDALPEGLRRFCDPKAPGPARAMAAKGLVPVKGNDLLTLLAQLSADGDENVAKTATASLDGLPDAVLLPACEGPLHPAVLAKLTDRFVTRSDVLERVVRNDATHDSTIARIASFADEPLSELIATNQQRLLGAPEIIEALYRNKRTRMSTADRIVELAARHGLELTGIPAYKEHVEALRGQLIPEPTDEPLPSDVDFSQTLAEDDGSDDAIDRDLVDGTETVKEQFTSLSFRIKNMTVSEKIRLALVGDAAARSILVRDPNRIVSYAAISSPTMTESEATGVAHSKEVGEDVLRFIGKKREWMKGYEIKRALVFNPKTPVGISMKYLQHLRPSDLKNLARSRGVPGPLKTAAQQRITSKGKE